MVDEQSILTIVEHNRGDLHVAAKALINAANRRGGEDNITVVLFEVVEDGDETAVYPAPAGEASTDDEDTLTEADGVPALNPAVDTMIVPLEEIEQHEDDWLSEQPTEPLEGSHVDVPREPLDARLPRRVLWIGAGICILLIVAALIVWGLSRAYFIGAQRDGRVAVYQGVPWDIAGSLRLYRPVYVSERLRAAYLSPAERRSLFDHDLVDRSTAQAKVQSLESDIVP
jgi:hypothetical protein